MSNTVGVRITVNGETRSSQIEPRLLLVAGLRLLVSAALLLAVGVRLLAIGLTGLLRRIGHRNVEQPHSHALGVGHVPDRRGRDPIEAHEPVPAGPDRLPFDNDGD